MGLLLIYFLRREYFRLELRIKDPILEAILFMPFRYLAVRFLEDRPQSDRSFHMTPTNAFVINMDSDIERMETFQSMNNNSTMIQRFSATAWRPDKDATKISLQPEQKAILRKQESWEHKYPFVRYSARRGHYGDAGCSLSHIRLLQHFLLSDEPYMFVFEDDARILEALLSKHTVQAPADADVVFLISSATKTVNLPYRNDPTQYATRVIQGYGAFGYVVTKEGAQKLLSHLERYKVPIDVALTGSTALRIYMSKTAQVMHRPGHYGSIRHTRNN